MRRPPTPPLFPYTTLFRSQCLRGALDRVVAGEAGRVRDAQRPGDVEHAAQGRVALADQLLLLGLGAKAPDDIGLPIDGPVADRKSTRLNSSHRTISYAVFC